MGSLDLLKAALQAVEDGHKAAIATVVRTDRSVPRRVGAAMLIVDDGTQNWNSWRRGDGISSDR